MDVSHQTFLWFPVYKRFPVRGIWVHLFLAFESRLRQTPEQRHWMLLLFFIIFSSPHDMLLYIQFCSLHCPSQRQYLHPYERQYIQLHWWWRLWSIISRQLKAAPSKRPCGLVSAKTNMLGSGWSFLLKSWERASQPDRLKESGAPTKAVYSLHGDNCQQRPYQRGERPRWTVG